MGRPKGSKNRVKQSEEPPKTTRQSTSIASSSSSSSSCTSVPLVPIISHEQQTTVASFNPLPEGFRGKPLSGRGSRGGRGRNSTNNTSAMLSVPIPNIVPNRGKGGRGKGRGNSISNESAFSLTTEQPALNIPDEELLSLPRSHIQQHNTSLINSNALPPVTDIISRIRPPQLLNEFTGNDEEMQESYRVPIPTLPTIESYTMPVFGSQSTRSKGSNKNASNNSRGRGRGRGASRGKSRGGGEGTSRTRRSKKPGESQQISPILDQQVSPVMNLTTTNLPSYDMSLCTTTISSTIPSTSIATTLSLTTSLPPSYDDAVIANTSPSQINSIPSSSQMMANQTGMSYTTDFDIPWKIPNEQEKNLSSLKKSNDLLPALPESSSNNSAQTRNINDQMKNELTKQVMTNPNMSTTTIPTISSQLYPYDASFSSNQPNQQRFQQNLPLSRLEDGDLNLNYNTNQQSMQPTSSSFTTTTHENINSSNNYNNMNLMFNDNKSNASDAIKNQIAENRMYQPQQPNTPRYPALSRQQIANMNLNMQRQILDIQLQQMHPNYQKPQQPSILFQTLQQQQQLNAYSYPQNPQNTYIPTQQRSLYATQTIIDEQNNGQSTSSSFIPFTSLENPVIITTTNSTSTTTTNCDLPSTYTAVNQVNSYPSNTESSFQQQQPQPHFFSNFSGNTMTDQNTVANNENTFSDRGPPPPPPSFLMDSQTTPSNSTSSFGLKEEEEPDLKLKEEQMYLESNNEQSKCSTHNMISTHQKKNDLSSESSSSSSSTRSPIYDNDNISRNNTGSFINENKIDYNAYIQSSSSSTIATTTTMLIEKTTGNPETILRRVEGLVICHSPEEEGEDSDTITASSSENNESRDAQNVESDLEISHDEVANTVEIGQEDMSSTLENVNEENSYNAESEHENTYTNSMEVENQKEEGEDEIMDTGKEINDKDSFLSDQVVCCKNTKVKVKGLNKNRQKQKQKNCSTSTAKRRQYRDTEKEIKTTQQQQQVESSPLMDIVQSEKQGRDSITSGRINEQSMDVQEQESVSFGETVEDSQKYNASATTTIKTATPNFNVIQQTEVLMSEASKPKIDTREEEADFFQTAHNKDESKKVNAGQQTAGENQNMRTGYRVTKKGIITYRIKSNRQQSTPSGKNRWMYNSEHKATLFEDGKFVIDRQDTFVTEDIFVWRIIKKGVDGQPCLRKFVPIQIDGRECHTGVDTFVSIQFNENFYNNFQPVIFRMLADTKDIQIGMLYRIDRSLPLLGYLSTTEHLFPDFKNFLMEITKMCIKGEYTGSSPNEPFEKSADNPIENYFSKMINVIIADPKWPDETLSCVVTYPKISTSKSGVVKSEGCKACQATNKKAIGAFKLHFSGPLYQPSTLQLLSTNEEDDHPIPPDFQFCHACPGTLRTLHRMIHYKWWTCATIRAQIADLHSQLKKDEQFRAGDIFEYFMGDFEWVEKMFLEFQILAIEGKHAINKAQKQEKFQQKRNSTLPSKACRKTGQEKRKITLPLKTAQPDQEKEEQIPLNTSTEQEKIKLNEDKSQELLPPVPSLATLNKILNSQQRRTPIKRRQQTKFRVATTRRKFEVPKLDTSSQYQMSEEKQESPAAGNSRPRRKKNTNINNNNNSPTTTRRKKNTSNNNSSPTTTRRKSLEKAPFNLIPDEDMQKILKTIQDQSKEESSMNETKLQEIETESGQEMMKEDEKEHEDTVDDSNEPNN